LRNVLNALGTEDGQTYFATVDNTITNTDLKFNINTAINNAIRSDNRQKVNNALDALNGYFNQPNESYEVNVSTNFSGLNINPSFISGNFYVVNTQEISLPSNISEINISTPKNELFTQTLSYTPADANVSCTSSIIGVNCNAQNGTITLEGNITTEGTYTGILDVKQYAMGQVLKDVAIPMQVVVTANPLDQIPAEARNNYLEINSSQNSDTKNDVTLSKVTDDANGLKIYFEPVSGNPSNSSTTITIKKDGNVIATLSPDDRYNGKTFYILYNNEVVQVTYDKDDADNEIIVNL
jgi:hypothetical protein